MQELHILLLVAQRWWEHSNPTCGNQICLNFLHSQVVGMLKHLALAPAFALTPTRVQEPPCETFQNI